MATDPGNIMSGDQTTAVDADQNESESLWKAAAYGDLRVVQVIGVQGLLPLATSGSPRNQQSSNSTLSFLASQAKTWANPSIVKRPDDQGFFALQWAALNNRLEVVDFLIGEGAQVNAVDHTGQTALHWAAVRGSLPAAESLLQSTADLRLRDCRGCVHSC